MRGLTVTIGDAIVAFLRESGLEQPVLETRIVELWPEVMGDTVARLTRSVKIKNAMLIVHISSAALKAQLFDCRFEPVANTTNPHATNTAHKAKLFNCRFELVAKLNNAAGAKVLRDVRILG